MRQYQNKNFALEVAELAQDVLDSGILKARPCNEAPSSGSNLGRAGRSTGEQTLRALLAMHAIEKAWLDLCALELPSQISRKVDSRLREIRLDLLDVVDEIEDRWRAGAAAIWAGLSAESKIRRLRYLAKALEKNRNPEAREHLLGHLEMRCGFDPEAARLAGIDTDAYRRT